MSGKSRLSIFCAVVWVLAWAFMYFIIDGSIINSYNGEINWGKMQGLIMIGFVPPFLGLLARWVWVGFKVERSE